MAGVISTLIALVAVLVAVWQLRVGSARASGANSAPVISRIFDEFRSPELRRHIGLLLAHADDEPDPGGFTELDLEWRESAYAVCYFHDYLGTLVAHQIVDADIVVGTIGNNVVIVWRAMEHHILAERAHREKHYPDHVSPGFLRYFEHLVALIIEQGGGAAPAAAQKRIGLKQLAQPLRAGRPEL